MLSRCSRHADTASGAGGVEPYTASCPRCDIVLELRRQKCQCLRQPNATPILPANTRLRICRSPHRAKRPVPRSAFSLLVSVTDVLQTLDPPSAAFKSEAVGPARHVERRLPLHQPECVIRCHRGICRIREVSPIVRDERLDARVVFGPRLPHRQQVAGLAVGTANGTASATAEALSK